MLDMTTKRDGQTAGTPVDTALNAGMAWWDLMLRMQRASMASFSVYSPTSETRISASLPQPHGAGTQVIPVGEERLNVATRTELGETTRIRRRVVARPVEQEVTLREERVIVERRPAPRPDAKNAEVLTETVIEMSDSRQVPQVWKSVHVAEEVVLRREVTERKERVRETLRRDVVEVEHDSEGREERRRAGAEIEHAAGAAEDRTLEAVASTAQQAEAARERTQALAEAARRATIAAVSEPPKPGAAAAQPHAAPERAGQDAAQPITGEPRRGDDAKDRATSQPGSPRRG